MDKLVINNIKLYTLIGIHDWEQSVKQLLVLDLILDVDAAKSALSDAIETTLDYDKLVQHVLAFVDANHFQLIETLAHKIAEEILQYFPTNHVALTLHKPGALKSASDVAIRIERSR